jgi:CubicO group peptidase (beta-lactamase class C family)
MASQSVAHGESSAAFVPELERLIAEVMEEWQIPGLALAVVQNGEVAFARAYGLRDVGAGLPVTPDTQFQIASVTKSFTATGLALLVDEGRMEWKKPVREYLPEFRLQDPVATDRVTVRDVLSHHSGLPRHDWIWLPGDRSPAQLLTTLRYVDPSDDIRSSFQYSNLGYVVASLVTERVSGQSWPEFIRTRLTDPLHMTVSFTVEDLAVGPDAALPYEMDGDTRVRSKLWPVRATAVGGMNTSIAGLANWLRLHLGKGEFERQRLLSAAVMQELQMPRVHVGPPEFAEYGDTYYGLGLRSRNYRGERVVWHGGGWIGTNALIAMLPDRGVGVAVLTNSSTFPEIFANYVFDRVSGREPIPWLDRLRERRRAFLAQLDIDREAQKAAGQPNPRPSHDLADYAGDYEHPGYGRITIAHAAGTLSWAFRGLSDPLTHRHDDTFELPEVPQSPGNLLPGRLAISFSADTDGHIASLAVPFDPLVKPIVFTRVATGG